MSANLRLLTEEESASIAEVTIDTIRKYRDCGLLDPIVKENQTFFQELDIRTLFYTKFKDHNPLFAIKTKPPEATVAPETVAAPAPEAATPYEEKVVPDTSEKPSHETSAEAVTPEFIDTASQSKKIEESVSSSLPPSAEMIELNKSLRLQIQILREERDWLRERIERLEARSEREQMLLLSQNENVRNLIKTTSKKGFWAKALPWLAE